MAEHLADDLGVNTAAEKEGCGRMAKVMKAYVRQSSFREQRLERPLDHVIDTLVAIDRALALDDMRIDDWQSRGETLYMLGRYEEALATYERALKLAPTTRGLWFNKSIILRILKRDREADEADKRSNELAFGGRFGLW